MSSPPGLIRPDEFGQPASQAADTPNRSPSEDPANSS
jgi:hypothetical protein